MYNIALCDDDISFYHSFEPLLDELLSGKSISYHLDYHTDAASLQKSMESGTSYDLIFLDILIGTDNGIDFAKTMRSLHMDTSIIFVTSSPEYALDGYDVAPIHFLIKPLNREKMEAAIDRFLKIYDIPKFTVQTPTGILSLPISEILYFEIYSHKILITKTNGEQLSFNGSLTETEELLPPFTFVRPHKSYLVNMAYISQIIRYKITLVSGQIIPIGKARYTDTQQCFIDYAEQKASR